MYYAVIAGYNAPHDSKPLTYAESDASSMQRFLVGGLGPIQDERSAPLFTATAASAQNITGALYNAHYSDARYLLFYFSGHGNDEGILTSSGFLYFSHIIDLIQFSGIPFVTVILDTCGAGGYASHLKEATIGGYGEVLSAGWLELLANATPGTRLFLSTGPGRSAIESSDAGGGHFTQTLLRVLTSHWGDLQWRGHSWISDQAAFGATARIMREMYGAKQSPIELGITGDFPLAVSQRGEPVGDGDFGFATLGLRHGHGTIVLDVVLHRRKNVATKLVQEISNSRGTLLYTETITLHPGYDHTRYEQVLVFPISKLLEDPPSRLQRRAYGRIRYNWALTLLDQHNQIIDFKIVDAVLTGI